MSVFEFPSYRAYLLHLCDQADAYGLRSQLSAAANCQPSYLSQALKGKVHLTEDHLAGISRFLKLGIEETEYLFLLLREERAGTAVLKGILAEARQKLLAKRRNLKNRIKLAGPAPVSELDIGVYLSSWVPSAVHLLTSDPRFHTVDAIAKRLHIPQEKVGDTLRFLEKAGFVEKTQKGWKYKHGSIHVPKDSPWQVALQSTRRELAARSIALNPKEAVHFSSVFTIDVAELKKLEQLAADFVENSHSLIHRSGTERLAAICLDVFEVV